MDEAAERHAKSERLDWFLTCLNHSLQYLKDDNVAKALNNFVREYSVDLVTVIPHEHDLMERLLTRSVTKDLIFHTHVPLLILPTEVKYASEAYQAINSSDYHKGFIRAL